MKVAALGLGVALVLSASRACALTGTLCQLPGNCTSAWSQKPVAGVIFNGTPLFTNHTGCAGGSNCYPATSSGLNLNLYIGWANDATVPWTLAQKQTIVALLSAIGTTQWFSDMAAMYPPSNEWGAASTGATMTLTNCLSGSPPHCADWTYTPGLTNLGTCPGVSLPDDPFGIYINMASQPNATCSAGQGANVVKTPNGHCVCAGQTVDGTNPACLGGTLPSPFGTVNSFTVPAVGSSVTITLATGTWPGGFNAREYIEQGAGWYSIATGGGAVGTATNLGTPVNASPGTVIPAGANAEHSPAPLMPNGCVLDDEIAIMLTELVAAVENFHGQGWGHYLYPSYPPAASPNNTNPPASHEDCPITAFGDLTPFSGQLASDLTTSMFSTTYHFVLAPWLRNSQVASDITVGPFGYCSAHRSYPDYWNIPCRQNADCPAVSGVCSGTMYGSHCAGPSCSDGIQNGFETDVDCGSLCPNGCGPGKKCTSMWDCANQFAFGLTFSYCVSGVCTAY